MGHIGYRRLKAFIECYRMGWFGLFKPINAAVYTSYTKEFFDRVRMLVTQSIRILRYPLIALTTMKEFWMVGLKPIF